MLNRTVLCALIFLYGFIFICSAQAGNVKNQTANKSHFTLWQLPSQVNNVGMSYVLRTANGKVIVFDGGWVQEAPYMRKFLAGLGNKVDAWFMSHPHDDHAGVLLEILKKPDGIKIDRIYQSSLAPEWYSKVELEWKSFTDAYYAAVKKSGVESVEVDPGMKIVLDGVEFEILSVRNPEILSNPYNNSSVVVKVVDSTKSVLFLGDLGVEGGKKLMAGPYASKVKAVYVQMAHHGQRGVNEDFYKAVAPKYCLWPIPKWLWNNDSGKGFNSGTWETLKNKVWINRLNVAKHYLSYKGLVKID